jgi:hypothetical protein
MAKIKVQDTEISLMKINGEDYICLTDMIKAKDGDFFVTDWLRNRNTLEYIGIWEKVYNPNFNYGEFAIIRNQAGLNRFKISVKDFVAKTNAISIQSKAGRYGGTYAHKDIAFEFAMWISPEFKIYIVKEFQRMKSEEQKLIGWSAKRELSKINYRIHTDAIKHNLIPVEVTPKQANIIYADEADVLNVAMFGITAKIWREKNPDLKGNIRDYATINELICLSNMESLNAVFIDQGLPQNLRLIKLNRIAIQQMRVLDEDGDRKIFVVILSFRTIRNRIIMASKLWEKTVQLNHDVETYTVGHDREMDMYLARYDVLGSLAHITMLESIGLLTADELANAHS